MVEEGCLAVYVDSGADLVGYSGYVNVFGEKTAVTIVKMIHCVSLKIFTIIAVSIQRHFWIARLKICGLQFVFAEFYFGEVYTAFFGFVA